MAMTGMRTVSVSAGLVHQAPPQQVAGEAEGPARAGVELAHWAFGACGGAMFAALPASLRQRAWTGPGYGLMVMAAFEAAAPLIGLPHHERAGVSDRLALAADHILYGFVLDEMRRAPQR